MPVGVRVCEQIEGWALDYDSDGSMMNGYEYTRQGRIDTDRIYYFPELMSSNYLPFTFAEYHYGETNADSKAYIDFYNNTILPKSGGVFERFKRLVDTGILQESELPAFSGAAVEETQVIVKYTTSVAPGSKTKDVDLTAPYMTYGTYKGLLIGSNYTVSDVFFTFRNPQGEIIQSKIWRASTASARCVYVSEDKNIGGAGDTGSNLYIYTNDIANKGNTITIEIQLSTGEKRTLYHGYFGVPPTE